MSHAEANACGHALRKIRDSPDESMQESYFFFPPFLSLVSIRCANSSVHTPRLYERTVIHDKLIIKSNQIDLTSSRNGIVFLSECRYILRGINYVHPLSIPPNLSQAFHVERDAAACGTCKLYSSEVHNDSYHCASVFFFFSNHHHRRVLHPALLRRDYYL